MGSVQRITDFGAFIEVMPGVDGLLHVSEMANYRVANVRDELKEGEQVECPESEVRHQIPGAAPAWQGATTENTARIRGRSNAARRDAPPGIW